GGGFFFRQLADAVHTAVSVPDTEIADALWDLVFAGVVTSDTLAPLRARLTGGRTTHRPRAPAPRARLRGPSGLAMLSGRLRAGQNGGRPVVAGAGRRDRLDRADPRGGGGAAGSARRGHQGCGVRGGRAGRVRRG